MRKKFTMGIVTALVAWIFAAGCGKEKEEAVDSIAGTGREEVSEMQTSGQEEDVLTFGTIYRGEEPELARVIQAYNEQGGPYTVELINYAENAEDYEAVESRFLMELMSGKGPDVIDLISLDKNSMGAAGALADLYELMPESQKDFYVPNVLNCMETEGKLYGAGPRFALYTIVANKEKVGDDVGWTMGEMLDILEQYGKGAEAVEGFYADESTVTTLGKFTLDDYIDWNEGKASFVCEEFYKMLEFDEERRRSQETEKDRPEFTDLSRAERVEQGHTIASLEILTSVPHYQIVNEIYGGEAVLKGFPTSEGTGIAIEMYSTVGINANGGKEEAAWDFVKFYLEEYEDIGFPLLNDKFEMQMADAMKQEYTAEGELIPKEWSDNFAVYAATEEDVAAVCKAISVADRACVYNDSILQIINEEADAFCKDGVTVERAAENINNRVQLYLDEICCD